ncbi:MAG: hypothetical protein UX31_C0017G0021 [Candidatus Nomurabacteria bacterium GW2011_GWA1_46_11]|uniref:Phage-Barnase-EndoU-ColicinE5/D-RelE like nuclease 3 domain-containing protein n=2 Tax=Parcubacteria group TaxID=1794811 RepID=A0A1G1YYS9_9BACT|nr:MAG: hypothetical protein UX29_C0016G0020 [Parcubacteria group bacterium GW2011_GWA2_46_10]KKU21437.1 MAG: hypothetical protein UX31_C0017G0021 [Candidatus Nomurabacteria bacterium GW2011_GWA1_46_11]OGY56800.1 MAG: hypothetical protein A2119_01980 [Candidatus Colwellbacteria bacterium GWA2_46_10]
MLQYVYYHAYIRGTPKRGPIVITHGQLCKVKPSLLKELNKQINFVDRWVYLSTKALKHIHDRHIFDKNSPDDFKIILDSLTQIIKYPDEVRKNHKSKRGDFLFIKKINNYTYYVSLEVINASNLDVVSASVTGTKYIEKLLLLWSWDPANPPS